MRFECHPLFDSPQHFFIQTQPNFNFRLYPNLQKFIIKYDRVEDFEVVRRFLLVTTSKSMATFNSYRSEAERFLLWSWTIKGRSVLAHKQEDIQEYIEFVINPPKQWIGMKNVSRFRNVNGNRTPNLEWRPFVARRSKSTVKTTEIENKAGIEPDSRPIFVPELLKANYTLSQKSVQEVFSNLSSLYMYLSDEDYVNCNIAAVARAKSKSLTKKNSMGSSNSLNEFQWKFVISETEQMAIKDSNWERSLFIVVSMRYLYLNISELSLQYDHTPTMGDFYKNEDGGWNLKVIGQGKLERNVTVPDTFLSYLRRYREHRNLTPLPSDGELTSLIATQRKPDNGLASRQLSNIVQTVFDHASEKMVSKGYGEEAIELFAASSRWLRNTGISTDIESRSISDFKSALGRSTIAPIVEHVFTKRLQNTIK